MPDIDLNGATYQDVPAVELPKSGGGMARFYDPDEIDYASSPTSGGNANRTNAILYGSVDSTSTATAFTATVAGLDQLVDGTCVMLHNGVVTSASGFTVNINGLGAKPCYSNMTNATRDTTIFNVAYTMLMVYSSSLNSGGGGWWIYRGYNSDTNTIGYQLRTNSTAMPAITRTRYYRLLFTSADGTKWVPANTGYDNSATSNKTVNSNAIDPFGRIVYMSGTTNVNAGSNVGATVVWDRYAFGLGYSFNSTGAALTLTYPAPVYVKCTPQASGSAIIDSTTPIVQELPTAADGKIYIYLGMAYSATNVELVDSHPVYWHDGTGVRLWTAGGIVDGSVTNNKLADDSVRSSKIANGAIEEQHLSNELKEAIVNVAYVSADAQTEATLAQAGITAPAMTPTELAAASESNDVRTRLCWIDMNSMTVEIAAIGYSVSLQNALTLYARGLHSVASGVAGVDDSWTVTAL